MEFLGVGPMELAFVLLLALIILGPKDMAKAGKQLGSLMRKIVTSDTWKAVKTTSRELQTLPNRLMRESGLDEEVQNLNNISRAATINDPDLSKTNYAPRSFGSSSPQPGLEEPSTIPGPKIEPPAPETPAQPPRPPAELHN